jgi:tRNA dimethylallyltransferase
LSGDSAAPELRVICGPTGAGKSRAALALAEKFGSVDIVSADSRQVYRGFDIGTAKPSRAERARVPHHGIDIVEPTERYSAARWTESAREWIDTIKANGRTPLVVGGTGLYLKALFGGLFDEPPLDAAQRASLASHLDTLSTDELRRWVASLDPARAHLGRTQLLRAIEIATLTGMPISHWHRDAPARDMVRARILVVDPGAVLAEWNAARTDAMIAAGWLDETRALMTSVAERAPAWNACGYATMRRLACGDLDPAAARDAIVIETRQYAKRQRTWFRHQLAGHEVTPLDPTASDWESRLAAWWTDTASVPK